MEYIKKHKNSSELLSLVIPQILLSISIFSFLFSYSSLSSSSSSSSSSNFLYSPKFHHLSSNYFHLNKNCLFLICNGLLVLVAKTSGLVRPPTAHELSEMLQKRIGGGGLETASLDAIYNKDVEFHVPEETTAADHHPEEEDDDEQGNQNEPNDQDCLITESPREVSIFIAESELSDDADKEVESQSRKCWLFDDEEQIYGEEVDQELEEENEHDEEETVNTQELNQRFDEFIRRMKEEILIGEARNKLITLN